MRDTILTSQQGSFTLLINAHRMFRMMLDSIFNICQRLSDAG